MPKELNNYEHTDTPDDNDLILDTDEKLIGLKEMLSTADDNPLMKEELRRLISQRKLELKK